MTRVNIKNMLKENKWILLGSGVVGVLLEWFFPNMQVIDVFFTSIPFFNTLPLVAKYVLAFVWTTLWVFILLYVYYYFARKK